MAQNDFDIIQIISDAASAAGRKKRGYLARKWFQDNVKQLFAKYTPNDRKNVIGDNTIPIRGRKYQGKMYMYMYDPKHKKTLPYYDKFPLVFILEIYQDGFLGINLHYIPLKLRIVLLKRLESIASDKNFDENTRLLLSYQTLVKFSKFSYAQPCIKRYLFSHVRSRIRMISAANWTLAIFLPTARWEKAAEARVHNESRKIINKRRRFGQRRV